MDPHRKGELTEAVVVRELKRRGIAVSIPFGDNERYDLVAESSNDLYRIQVKTGSLQDGVVVFRGNSQHTNADGNTYKKYDGDIDYFVVFCHENEGMYLVEEGDFYNMRLRIDEPRQIHETINWAAEFEFDERWPPAEDDVDLVGTVDRTVRDLRDRGISVFEAGEDAPYDVLLERPSGEFAQTSIRPGTVVDGRVRFDMGRTRAPGPEAVDVVVVSCTELDELYLVERDEYGESISLRVGEPVQAHPGTNRAAEFEFDERWPVG